MWQLLPMQGRLRSSRLRISMIRDRVSQGDIRNTQRLTSLGLHILFCVHPWSASRADTQNNEKLALGRNVARNVNPLLKIGGREVAPDAAALGELTVWGNFCAAANCKVG